MSFFNDKTVSVHLLRVVPMLRAFEKNHCRYFTCRPLVVAGCWESPSSAVDCNGSVPKQAGLSSEGVSVVFLHTNTLRCSVACAQTRRGFSACRRRSRILLTDVTVERREVWISHRGFSRSQLVKPTVVVQPPCFYSNCVRKCLILRFLLTAFEISCGES